MGRLLRGINDEGKLQNTLVIYVVGDNGGSAEGGLEGSDHNFAMSMGAKTEVADMLTRLDDLGSPYVDNHYAAGGSWATTAPFQWMKQVASHFGGTRDGLVISWPGHTTPRMPTARAALAVLVQDPRRGAAERRAFPGRQGRGGA